MIHAAALLCLMHHKPVNVRAPRAAWWRTWPRLLAAVGSASVSFCLAADGDSAFLP